jgi:CheY-like chemotaxis protein
MGMTPEVLARIFEPFFTTKPVGKGTGLGLAQVYGLVKRSGGELMVKTEPGVGSSFTVFLPECDPARLEPGAKASTGHLALPEFGAKRVLLVDDNAEVRNTVEWILKQLGYKTHTACNGIEALAAFAQQSAEFDAVISDVVMPELGGIELAKALRNRDYKGAIILTSGYFPKAGIDPDQVSSAIDGFLQKPVRTKELVKVLGRCLRSKDEARS